MENKKNWESLFFVFILLNIARSDCKTLESISTTIKIDENENAIVTLDNTDFQTLLTTTSTSKTENSVINGIEFTTSGDNASRSSSPDASASAIPNVSTTEADNANRTTFDNSTASLTTSENASTTAITSASSTIYGNASSSTTPNTNSITSSIAISDIPSTTAINSASSTISDNPSTTMTNNTSSTISIISSASSKCNDRRNKIVKGKDDKNKNKNDHDEYKLIVVIRRLFKQIKMEEKISAFIFKFKF